MVSTGFQWIPSFILWEFVKISREESVAYRRVFRTYITKTTAAEVITRGVVHWPVSSFGVGFGSGENDTKIIDPFVELAGSTVGKTADELIGGLKENLSCIDDDAFDRRIQNDLPSEGIEGHLVVGFELREVVLTGGGGCGLAVHDEELVVEIDDTIEVATEEVGLGRFVTSRARP